MVMHQQQFQLQSQLQHQQHQIDPKPYRNVVMSGDGIQVPYTFFNAATSPSFVNQNQAQYIPPFHVAGFAPGSMVGRGGNGVELGWEDNNNGFELSKRKGLKEEVFLDNTCNNPNSQISSLDFFQTRSVSTGLGLSLDDKRSSGDSSGFSLFDDEIDRELQRQEAEMDRFIEVQGEQLRQAILKKVQANQLQTFTFMEERTLQRLRDKEIEMEGLNKKNVELEERMKELSAEASAWHQQAKYNENMITALKYNLQQAVAQSKDSKEGGGDSEVDDTASCCNGGAIDFHLMGKEHKDLKNATTCKACKVNEVSMLLLPCRHLCLCKDCEGKLRICPTCQSSKYFGMEVYM